MEDNVDLASTFQAVSKNFGVIFQDINVHLVTMANAWKQKLDNKSNKILEEVMKLDGISFSKVLEVATILMAEKTHALGVLSNSN